MFNFTNTNTNGRPVREIRQRAKAECLEAAITTALDHAAALQGVITESGHYDLTGEDKSKLADSIVSSFFPAKEDPNRTIARDYYDAKIAELVEEEEEESEA